MQTDQVDKILSQWKQVRPDLDCSAMGVVGRLRRISNLWKKKLEPVFKAHQLSNIEFDILATMRRNEVPLTPTELYQTLMLSSGATSTRIESLVKQGFVERIASDKDRRSCKVTLTQSGIELVDNALQDHVANMDRMLHPLSNEEREQLAALLKKVLIAEK